MSRWVPLKHLPSKHKEKALWILTAAASPGLRTLKGEWHREAMPPAQGHPARDQQNQDSDLDLTPRSCVPPTAPRYCKPIPCLTSPVFQSHLKAAEDASSFEKLQILEKLRKLSRNYAFVRAISISIYKANLHL